MRRLAWARQLVVWLGLVAWPWLSCHAGSMQFCDQPTRLSAEQKDRLLRWGAVIKAALEDSGQRLALIARSGLDLSRFDVRYSHAGLSLKAGLDTPWAVRQLYYACDERRPRVFDQGMAGFLLGLNDPEIGYVSIVLLPAAEATALERAALDKRQALQALGAAYSANAYPFSVRYQNCNQWVAEMIATAWGRIEAPPAEGDDAARLRLRAQRWLMDQGYRPSVFDVNLPLMVFGGFVPWLHNDDHPSEDLERMRLQVSMPASIENFVRATVPGATRIEFCHAGARVVVHRGWDPIAEGCQPGEHDTVVTLD